MKISDYMPELYNRNIEMNNIIDSEEDELEDRLKFGIENSFKDTFAVIATEKGLQNFEKMFNIKVNPDEDTLEFRRQRIISRLVSSIPFTETYLKNQLNMFLGKGTWNYTIDYNNYSITINSLKPGNAWYQELLDFLDRTIPCNMDWIINIYSATWAQVYETFNTWQDLYDSEMTWQDVMDGEWL